MLSTQSYSQTNEKPKAHVGMDAPKTIRQGFTKEQFKPHMLNHFNEGCPANSECTPRLGELYKEWTELAQTFSGKSQITKRLDSFRRRNGIPFPLWITEEGSSKDNLIVWDSPCENHNLKNEKKIKIGLAFVDNLKKLNSLKNDQKVILRFLRIDLGNGKFKEIETLRDENPLYLDGEKLIYQLNEEGAYFGLSVSPTGDLEVVDTKTPPEFPRSIDCPDYMEKSIKEKEVKKNLYSGFYCQSIWNNKKAKYDIVQVGWSCN